jgi:hypothetical protein
VLVAGDEAIGLVDLSDSYGPEGIPPRERVTVAWPVRSLASSPSGLRAVALLEDGTFLRVELDPLRVHEEGRGFAIAWPGEKMAYSPAPEPIPEREPEPAEPVREVPPPVLPAEPPEQARARPERVESPIPSTRAPEPVASPPSSRPVKAEPPAPREPPAPQPRSTPVPGEVRGTVRGPAADQVVAVVLLGPDNVLREAARVRPGADGAWSVTGLPPGAYRVVLDGGGKRFLETDPAFGTFRVEAGRPTEAPAILVIRAVSP